MKRITMFVGMLTALALAVSGMNAARHDVDIGQKAVSNGSTTSALSAPATTAGIDSNYAPDVGLVATAANFTKIPGVIFSPDVGLTANSKTTTATNTQDAIPAPDVGLVTITGLTTNTATAAANDIARDVGIATMKASLTTNTTAIVLNGDRSITRDVGRASIGSSTVRVSINNDAEPDIGTGARITTTAYTDNVAASPPNFNITG